MAVHESRESSAHDCAIAARCSAPHAHQSFLLLSRRQQLITFPPFPRIPIRAPRGPYCSIADSAHANQARYQAGAITTTAAEASEDREPDSGAGVAVQPRHLLRHPTCCAERCARRSNRVLLFQCTNAISLHSRASVNDNLCCACLPVLRGTEWRRGRGTRAADRVCNRWPVVQSFGVASRPPPPPRLPRVC